MYALSILTSTVQRAPLLMLTCSAELTTLLMSTDTELSEAMLSEICTAMKRGIQTRLRTVGKFIIFLFIVHTLSIGLQGTANF